MQDIADRADDWLAHQAAISRCICASKPT